MKLPPIMVTNGPLVKDIIHAHLGVICIDTIKVEEQCTYVTFKDVPSLPSMHRFLEQLSGHVRLSCENQIYVITPQYIDI